MTVENEMKNLEKVQSRLVRFCAFLEKQKRYDGTSSYDDLYHRVASVIGSIEDCLTIIE